MADTALVKAAPLADPALKNKRCVPREGTTRRFITENEPVEVALTPYYRRKIAKGELVVCEAPTPQRVERGAGLSEIITSSGADR